MGGHGDGGLGAERMEVGPELGGVGDEERVGVDEDGASDGGGEDLVNEELHEASCGGKDDRSGYGRALGGNGNAGTYGRLLHGLC